MMTLKLQIAHNIFKEAETTCYLFWKMSSIQVLGPIIHLEFFSWYFVFINLQTFVVTGKIDLGNVPSIIETELWTWKVWGLNMKGPWVRKGRTIPWRERLAKTWHHNLTYDATDFGPTYRMWEKPEIFELISDICIIRCIRNVYILVIQGRNHQGHTSWFEHFSWEAGQRS